MINEKGTRKRGYLDTSVVENQELDGSLRRDATYGDHVPKPSIFPPVGALLKFTDCCLFREEQGLVENEDLWVQNGIIIDAQKQFWEQDKDGLFLDPIVVRCGGAILAPGFFDIQINGAFGVNFADPSLNRQQLTTVTHDLLAHGVTAFLPTLVSSSTMTYGHLLPKFRRLIAELEGTNVEEDIGAQVVGLHLEGPFMNTAKKGAHRPQHLVTPEKGVQSIIETYGSIDGVVRLVTLAPEIPGSLDVVKALTAEGVLVSMGHSLATLKDGLKGLDAGAKLVTHLYNAMPAFHHRDPGLVGLLGISPGHRRPYYSIIADGLHSHPASVNIAFRAHPEGAILVTDAMPALGLGEGKHLLGDVTVDVSGNRAVVTGTDTLAGAIVPMDQCVRNFKAFTGCRVEEALLAASARPNRLIFGEDTLRGTLRPGAPADLVLLTRHTLDVLATYRNGVRVFEQQCDGGRNQRRRS